MKFKIDSNLFLYIIVIFVTALLFNSPGTGDVNSWIKVQEYMKQVGVIKTYGIFTGYPPLSFTILSIAHYKVLIVVSLLISTYMMYLWKKDYIFFYATFVLCCILGYIDIFYMPFLIGGLWFAEKKNIYGCVSLFTIALFIKWQPLIILPFVLIYCVGTNYKNIIKVVIPMLLISFFIVQYFGYNSVKIGFDSQVSQAYLSGNALNLNWIITYIMSPTNGEIKFIYSDITYPRLLFYFFYAITVVMFLISKKEFKDLLFYCMLGFMSYFMFNIAVHENHLFVAALFAVLLKEYIVSVMFNLNMFIFYGVTGMGLGINRLVFGYDITLFISILYIFIFFYFLYKAKSMLPKKPDIDYGMPDLGKNGKGINWKKFGSWDVKKL